MTYSFKGHELATLTFESVWGFGLLLGLYQCLQGSLMHLWLFVKWVDLVHDSVIDTLFGDGEWLFLKLVFGMLLGAGSVLLWWLEGLDLRGTC